MRTTAATRHLGYADVWEDYADRGWSPIPLPPGEKSPVPAGDTGKFKEGHKIPSYSQMSSWAFDHPRGNVAIVMPRTIIAIDIDAYHGGLDSIRALERKLGKLPETTLNSARTDGSGHLFFSVREGTRLVHATNVVDRELGGIEFLQYHHRYAVVWPSIHPDTGTRYRWIGSDGIPHVSDFPALPAAWLEHFRLQGKENGKSFDSTVEDWFDSLPTGKLSMCLAAEYIKKVRAAWQDTPASRHDTMVHMVSWLVMAGTKDRINVTDALADLRMEFIRVMAGERDAESEFDRTLSWAISNLGGI